jgi:cytoskeletal protein RodZ
MASDLDPRRSRKLKKSKRPDLRPSWSWLAIPLLVIGAVFGLWWGLYSPSESAREPTPTPTPTRIQRPQPSPTPTMAVLFDTPTVAPSATPTVVASIGTGRTVKVAASEGLNMRAGAGSNQDLVKTMPDGTILAVMGGPVEADGHTWWQVRDSEGSVGWCAEDWLELSLP